VGPTRSGVRLAEGKDFSDVFDKEVCSRLSAPVRQRNNRADFAGFER
jgi:hypothetical protein